MKYNYFHKEQHDKKRAENPFLPDNLFYNEQEDIYYCPMGQPMLNIGIKQDTTKTGFE